MNKRLLIFLGEYNGYINANKRIAITIEKELKRLGYTSFFACVNYFQKETNEIVTDGITIRVFPANRIYADDIKKYNYFKDIRGMKNCLLKHPLLTIENQLIKNSLRVDLIDGIKKMLKEKECTELLCFYYPFAPSYDLVVSDIECHKYVYQLDPWGLHEDINLRIKRRRIKQELQMFDKCEAVFTTSVLYKQYIKDKDYCVFKDKYVSMNFPNIREHSYCKQNLIKFDIDKINIVFLGIIDDSYRNPSSIVEFILNCTLNVRLYFIGKTCSPSLERYEEMYPERLVVHSPVNSNTADSIMMDRNIILLNIGNTYTNQLPSKISDYISTGNPIINTVKNPDDASIEMLKNYKNCYNFYEYKENDIHKFEEFLLDCKGVSIPFDQIRKLYAEYTPECVTKKLIDRFEKNDKV